MSAVLFCISGPSSLNADPAYDERTNKLEAQKKRLAKLKGKLVVDSKRHTYKYVLLAIVFFHSCLHFITVSVVFLSL